MTFMTWLGYRFEDALEAIWWAGENWRKSLSLILIGVLIGIWIV